MARALPFVIILLALGAPALADEKPQFDMPKGRPVPTNLILHPNSQIPWKVWVAYEGYRPRRGPSETADPVPGIKFSFMQPCFLADREQVGDAEFVFLAKADATGKKVLEPYGWVNAAYVVMHDQALSDPVTTISRKAMIVNTKLSLRDHRPLFSFPSALQAPLDQKTLPDTLRKTFTAKGLTLSPETQVAVVQAGASWTLTDAKSAQQFSIQKEGDQLAVRDSLAQAVVLDGPVAEAGRRTGFKLFNIFFVYGEAKNHVLLGSARFLADDPKLTVQGWIPRNRLVFWNTREALEWDYPSTVKGNRKEEGAILSSPETAYSWLRGQAPKNDAVLFTEKFVIDKKTERKLSRRFAYDDMRFPVLSWQETGADPKADPEGAGQKYPKKDTATNNELVRVGWAGGFGGAGGLDPDELKDLRRKLEAAQDSLKQVEIIFVIDDTFSMKKYLRATGEAVEAIVKETQLAKGARYRVAVSYYNDVPSPEPLIPRPLVDVVDQKKMDEIIKDAKNHIPHDGGDAPEMVFAGIKAAIDKSGYLPKARKLVIVIGDACDKSMEGADKHVQKKQVVDRLFPANGTPIEFFAIHMEEPVAPNKRDPVAVLFEEQMRAIAKLVNEDKRAEGETLATYVHSTNIRQMKDLINQRFRRLTQQMGEWNRQLLAIRRGEWHTEIAPGLVTHLNKHGIDVEQLRKAEGVQLFEEGFVWRYARSDVRAAQVRGRALLSGGDVDELIRILKAVVGSGSPIRSVDLSALVQEEVKRLTGDTEYKGQSIQEALSLKKYGLELRSPLLRKSAKDLKNVAPEDIRDLKLKLQRLEDMVASLEADWTWVPKKQESGEIAQVLSKTKTDKVRRYFEIPGDAARWYWVDNEEELP